MTKHKVKKSTALNFLSELLEELRKDGYLHTINKEDSEEFYRTINENTQANLDKKTEDRKLAL